MRDHIRTGLRTLRSVALCFSGRPHQLDFMIEIRSKSRSFSRDYLRYQCGSTRTAPEIWALGPPIPFRPSMGMYETTTQTPVLSYGSLITSFLYTPLLDEEPLHKRLNSREPHDLHLFHYRCRNTWYGSLFYIPRLPRYCFSPSNCVLDHRVEGCHTARFEKADL